MLVVMMMPLATSCGSDSDSDENTVDVSKAVGTWYCIRSTDKSGTYSLDNLFVGQSVTIYSNGKYTSTSSSFGTSGTYKINGNKIIVNTDSGRAFMITVSFSGNNMTWTGSGEGVTFTYVFEKEVTTKTVTPY